MTNTSLSPLLPLDLRLRSLEAQVIGSSSTFGDAGPLIQRNDHRSVTRRVRELQEGLDRLAGDSEGLKRLLAGYQQYLPLLALPSYDPKPTTSESPDEEERFRESDLLPDQTKVRMLLEAAQDIRAAERDLREIELLKTRGVEGSGTVEDLLPLRPNLMHGIKRNRERSKELELSRKKVSDLLIRYNEFKQTNTVSELFVSLHRRMEGLEEDVARVERSRRKEAAERF